MKPLEILKGNKLAGIYELSWVLATEDTEGTEGRGREPRRTRRTTKRRKDENSKSEIPNYKPFPSLCESFLSLWQERC
jgi:hypothetical protein